VFIDILDEDHTWRQPQGDDSDEIPYLNTRRWGHSASILPKHPQEILLFGGWDNQRQYNDLWGFNLATETMRRIETSGPTPHVRAGHCAVGLVKFLYIFGGAYCKGGPYVFFNDMHRLDSSTMTWESMECGGDVPPPMSQASMVLMKRRYLLLVGGYNGKKTNTNVYYYDMLLNLWYSASLLQGEGPKSVSVPEENFRVYPAQCSILQVHSNLFLILGLGKTPYFLDVLNWEWSKIRGQYPQINCGCTGLFTDNDCVIFGGKEPLGDTQNTVYSIRVDQ